MFKRSTTDRGTCVQTFAKLFIALLIVVYGNHPRSAAVHLLDPEWSWALSEVCKTPINMSTMTMTTQSCYLLKMGVI